MGDSCSRSKRVRSHRQSVPSYPLNQHHSLLINSKCKSKSKSKAKSKSKMPNIKLYYGEFPFWRAEVSRLALHLGKVPFENVTSMNLQALRESGKATLGQCPSWRSTARPAFRPEQLQDTVGSSRGCTQGTTTGRPQRLMRSSTLPLISRWQWEKQCEWTMLQRRQPAGLNLLRPLCQST